MMRLGDARFRDDFAGVNVPRRQVRQFVHARESSLFKHKKKFKSIHSKFLSHSMPTITNNFIFLNFNLIGSNVNLN